MLVIVAVATTTATVGAVAMFVGVMHLGVFVDVLVTVYHDFVLLLVFCADKGTHNPVQLGCKVWGGVAQ